MTKSELIHEVWLASDLPHDKVADVINALFSVVTRELARGEKVYTGLGTFLVRNHAERKGRNPRTGEEIVISACKLPAFRPSPLFKAALNQ